MLSGCAAVTDRRTKADSGQQRAASNGRVACAAERLSSASRRTLRPIDAGSGIGPLVSTILSADDAAGHARVGQALFADALVSLVAGVASLAYLFAMRRALATLLTLAVFGFRAARIRWATRARSAKESRIPGAAE